MHDMNTHHHIDLSPPADTRSSRQSPARPGLSRAGYGGLLSMLCLALAACGGGGGTSTASPGTGGTGSYTVGPISGFGSIIINGVRYDDSSAQVETEDGDTSDDDKGSLGRDDLQLGMITSVEAGSVTAGTGGALSTATASTISLSNEIKGPISAFNSAGNSFTLLQQTIRVNAGTVYANVASLAAANGTNCPYAEVYAYYNTGDNSYTATRLECKTTQPSSYRLFGPASNVVANTSFQINGLTINRGSQSMTGITTGTLVRARMGTTLTGTSSDVATATRLRTGSTRSSVSSSEAKVEGLIDSYTSDADFTVNGVRVVTNGSTSFESGVTLAVGVRVEVEGSLSSGVLTAREVQVEDETDLEEETSEFIGTVTNASGNTGGTFTLTTNSDRVFTVTYTTGDFKESSDQTAFGNGTKVEVKGVLASDGSSLDATRIQIED